MLEESWSLAKACFHIVRKDKEMLIYPAIIAAVVFLIILAFIISLFYNILVLVALLVSIPLLTVALSFIGVFFEAAVVGCAGIRLEGGNPKVKDGLIIAGKRWWPLFKWALIGILVGLLLGAVKRSFGGRRTPVGTYRPR
ncbi:MAG: DUF6159 family protein, partial [Candidatus Bathyarchaeota archaeon]|nr:DUF6159 family protein [Candidatus Bathyarchaeota archaeon]